MADGFGAINTITSAGFSSIFGSYELAALAMVAIVVGLLIWAGLDIVADVAIGGLLAVGFAYLGWLPFQPTLVIVLTLWGLGAGYFAIMFYNR